MKKIMFNDKYGLTRAVLDGQKTMTRRVIPEKQLHYLEFLYGDDIERWVGHSLYLKDDIVAIAESFKDAGVHPDKIIRSRFKVGRAHCLNECDAHYHAGWNNKMFVQAEYMPHRIRITGIKVERLQDISESDCMKEGITRMFLPCSYQYENAVYTTPMMAERIKELTARYDDEWAANDPKTAFRVLFGKICGKGIWETNPFVFAYSFELVS